MKVFANLNDDAFNRIFMGKKKTLSIEDKAIRKSIKNNLHKIELLLKKDGKGDLKGRFDRVVDKKSVFSSILYKINKALLKRNKVFLSKYNFDLSSIDKNAKIAYSRIFIRDIYNHTYSLENIPDTATGNDVVKELKKQYPILNKLDVHFVFAGKKVEDINLRDLQLQKENAPYLLIKDPKTGNAIQIVTENDLKTKAKEPYKSDKHTKTRQNQRSKQGLSRRVERKARREGQMPEKLFPTTVLDMSSIHPNPQVHRKRLFLKCLDGSTYELEGIPETATGDQVAEKLKELSGIEDKEYILVFAGKRCESQTLKEMHVFKEGTLHLVLKPIEAKPENLFLE